MMAMVPQSVIDETQSKMDRAESSSTTWEIVGVISEGDSVAHVAYRVAGMTPPAPTGILTLRAAGPRWVIHFTSPDAQLGHIGTMTMAAMQAMISP